MNRLKQIGLSVAFALLSVLANAQAANEDTGFMRSNGKVYVVVAVIVTIVVGLFLYLINLDRKISKLEKSK